jgi:hypothetical protein
MVVDALKNSEKQLHFSRLCGCANKGTEIKTMSKSCPPFIGRDLPEAREHLLEDTGGMNAAWGHNIAVIDFDVGQNFPLAVVELNVLPE